MPPLAYPTPPLSADGITLRGWRDADLEPAFAALQNPSIPRFTHVPADQDRAGLRRHVHGLDTARAIGEELGFVVADAATDALLGSASLLRLDWAHARAEIGYWIAAPARGRGAATIATLLITAWAFDTLPLHRIELRIDADNPASLAVARRAGFVEEGTLRSYETRKGRRPDVVVFSLLATDPR